MIDLLSDLVNHTHADADRHGENHIACPECGHISTPKDPHCSFSEKGWYCFSCGAGGSLQDLAKRLGLGERVYQAPQRMIRQEAPRKAYSWMNDAESLISRYEAHTCRFERWAAYKSLTRSTIESHRLGVGVLPASKCKHERLILPVVDGTMVVGLRGRAIDCTCGKWLASAGWDLDLVPLYNSESLRPGCVAWIVENPVDALLIGERTPYVGLATFSVSYWRERWLETLKAARPELVVVALDNDLPGNGGAARRQEFVQAWLRTHPKVPQANGIKLVNTLLKAGLRSVLYDWGRADNKADIGSLVAAGAMA
jgi:hypothetical protein